jgi:hypothetical protein
VSGSPVASLQPGLAVVLLRAGGGCCFSARSRPCSGSAARRAAVETSGGWWVSQAGSVSSAVVAGREVPLLWHWSHSGRPRRPYTIVVASPDVGLTPGVSFAGHA